MIGNDFGEVMPENSNVRGYAIQEKRSTISNDKFFFAESIDEYRSDLSKEDRRVTAKYSSADIMDIVKKLMDEFKIPDYKRDVVEKNLRKISDEARREEILSNLPVEPSRDIRPYEGIISYIRAEDGLGPWYDAGVLTRPLISKLSPRAYMSLANWLKNPRHSLEAEGLSIPNKFDLIEQDETVSDMRR